MMRLLEWWRQRRLKRLGAYPVLSPPGEWPIVVGHDFALSKDAAAYMTFDNGSRIVTIADDAAFHGAPKRRKFGTYHPETDSWTWEDQE